MPIQFLGDGTINANTGNLALAGVLSGTGGFTKQGANTATLSGANTYTGVTTIQTGILNVATLSDYGVAGSLGGRASASESLSNVGIRFMGGTLRYEGSTATSTDRNIRVGTAGATIDASGSNPSATMSFTKSTENVDIWDSPGARTLTLTGSNTGNNIFAINWQAYSDGGSIVKSGLGTWVLTNSNNSAVQTNSYNTFGGYGGGTTISGGTLGFVAGAIGGGRVSFTGNSTLRWEAGNSQDITIGMGGGVARDVRIENGVTATFNTNGNNVTLSGTVTAGGSSTGALTKSGAGILTLSGTNNYTGATTINVGTLRVSGGTAIANTSAVVLANFAGATFDIQTSETIGSLAGGGTSGGNVTIANGQTLTTGGTNASTIFAGVISGTTGTFTKTGNGTQTLTGANTYTGTTTISGGTLQLGNGGATGSLATSSAITVASGATFAINQNDTVTQGIDFSSAAITGAGGFSQRGSGTTILNTANTYTGTTTISGGTLQLGNGGPTGSLATSSAITVASGATFAINQSDTVTQGIDFSSAAINGAGGFSQVGSGTTILNTSNSYTGVTTVSNGTLLINGIQSAATGDLNVASGATLGGIGSVGGKTFINGGTHSPGSNAPGVMTHLGDLSYGANSTVQWELTSHTSGNGPSPFFDQIVVDGNLNFSGATTMDLNFNSSGSTVDWSDPFWDMVTVKDWLIYEVSGTTTGFSNLSLNAPANWKDGVGGETFPAEIGNNLPSNANFYLYQSGNNIYLRYEAIPEPAGFALLALAMGLVTMMARPRRRLVVA